MLIGFTPQTWKREPASPCPLAHPVTCLCEFEDHSGNNFQRSTFPCRLQRMSRDGSVNEMLIKDACAQRGLSEVTHDAHGGENVLSQRDSGQRGRP